MSLNRLLSRLLIALALLSSTACSYIDGNGRRIDDERTTPDFSRISIHNGFDLRVTVGSTKSVHLVGDENIVREIETRVNGDELEIGLPPMTNWTSDIGVQVEITVPSLEAVTRSGGGPVDVKGINASSFTFEGSGGGEVKLAGECDLLTIDTSGGTETNARALQADVAHISTSGGGSVDASVSEKLFVSASGGGDIRIFGRPSVQDQDLSGGSTLRLE
jgi:hypothetical protein